MKRLLIPLVVGCGFAAGWLLPTALSWLRRGGPDAANAGIHHERESETRKKELLDGLLDGRDREHLKTVCATSLVELLAVLRGVSDFGDKEVARIVGLEPAAALNQWLADPSVSEEMCAMVAVGWGRRNPEQAISFLLQKHSYRADDCLDKVLLGVRWSHPLLVGEVIRSKPREWQEKHLEDFFTGTYTVRKPGAPPEPVSQDPFEGLDDGYWITKKNGEDFLNDLADDDLRKKAVSFWIEKTPEPSPPDKPIPALDVANFDGGDPSQSEALRVQLERNPKQMLALLAARGCFEARKDAIRHMMEGFPIDRESWPAAFNKLETTMRQLEVIPEHPPGHFETGTFLRGEAEARWISRQPLGLQRAWSPDFTKNWAASEPELAIRWARSLPADANRDLAVLSGVFVWAQENPLDAAAYVESLPPGDLREASISSTAAAWDGVDRPGAVKWLESLPDSSGKASGLERLK
jgi:hypothetical protein